MRLYKLTDEHGCTRNNTQWGPGVTHTAKGSLELIQHLLPMLLMITFTVEIIIALSRIALPQLLMLDRI